MKYFFLSLIFCIQSTLAQNITGTTQTEQKESIERNDDIYVIGSKDEVFYQPGSAHFVGEKELKVFSQSDINRVLDKVPGVYIQEEDGLGLRPNIGLRGAHPHRSKKITIMEDGILVGPAPYSAPAAYYFPSSQRTQGLEVFKGPSSVKYGPNSIGGAVNMLTPSFQRKTESRVEALSGSFSELLINTAGSSRRFSWLLQLGRKEGDLLKEIPGRDDPRFEQNDVLMKFNYELPGRGDQSVQAKISIASEDSDETYLGITPGDFNNNAFQRYSASQNDNIVWDRIGLSLSHQASLASNIKLSSTAYHHQMNRNWSKFNGLVGSRDFLSILNGNNNESLISLLRGSRNSLNSDENLIIGSNDRKYYSQGIQTSGALNFELGQTYHELSLGVRLHRDQVQRNHSEEQFQMVNGDLVFQEGTTLKTNRNEDTSKAISIFAENEMTYENLSVRVGGRLESVSNERDFRVEGRERERNSDSFFVPGVGLNYSLSDSFVLLGGVNKGFTLVGPGQSDDIRPEEAVNYEFGFRMKSPFYLEAIAFYSNYKNIKGTCSFSSGCDEREVDREFNGGQAEIYGLESMLEYFFKRGELSFPLRLGYTLTVARFKEEVESSNPEWGIGTIQKGDPLPYIPQSQVSLGSGIHYNKLRADITLLWKSQVADQAIAENRLFIPSFGVVDTAFSYRYSKKGEAFLRVNNLLDNKYLVSLRPFGARPGAPRTILAGIRQGF